MRDRLKGAFWLAVVLVVLGLVGTSERKIETRPVERATVVVTVSPSKLSRARVHDHTIKVRSHWPCEEDEFLDGAGDYVGESAGGEGFVKWKCAHGDV